jgi:ABC-type proline/glycine betaine transport system ATPase subunit
MGRVSPVRSVSRRREVIDIQRKLRKAGVIVTHDMEEAVRLGDRVVVMEGGHIAKAGSPEELHFRPATPFVTSLLGEDRAIKLLQTMMVSQLAGAGDLATLPATAPEITETVTLHDALGLTSGVNTIAVTDATGVWTGSLGPERLFALHETADLR